MEAAESNEIEENVLIILQIFIRLEKISYGLLKYKTDDRFLMKLKESIFHHNDNSQGVKNDFLYKIDFKSAELKNIRNSPNLLEEILLEIGKITKLPDSQETLIDYIFSLPKEFVLIDGNQYKRLPNESKHILSIEFANFLFLPQRDEKLVLITWPLSLCINIANARFELHKESLEVYEGPDQENFYYKVIYSAKAVLLKNKDQFFFFVKNRENQWNVIKSSRPSLDIYSALNDKNTTSKYVFYEREPFEQNTNYYKEFIKALWMNFFHPDILYSEIIKSEKHKGSWLKFVIDEFLKSQKKLNKIKEDKRNNRVNVKKNNYIELNRFSQISELTIQKTELGFKRERVNWVDVLRIITNEVHAILSEKMNNYKCPFCDQLVIRLSQDDLESKYFTSLQLNDDKDIFSFVNKVKSIFSEIFLSSVTDYEKFKGNIDSDHLKIFMKLKLHTNRNLEKIKVKYNQNLIFHLKNYFGNIKIISELLNLEIEEEKKGKHSYGLTSIILVYDQQNMASVIMKVEEMWSLISNIEAVFSNLQEALIKASSKKYSDIILFYSKIARNSSEQISTNGTLGTQPIRCENTENRNLCYINSAIQSIVNIYSFKHDLSKWNPNKSDISESKAWEKELSSIIKNELNEKEQGKKIYNFNAFRKKFIEDNKNEAENNIYNKRGNPCVFIESLLNKIHKNSYCSTENECPACKNFAINFILKNQIKRNYLITQEFKENIKLGGKALAYYLNKPIEYEISNPPWCLLYKRKSADNIIDYKGIKDYLINNQSIDYINNGLTYHYELKSIILYGNYHFKTLLFSRTYNLWMLTNDSAIEPLYIKLEDYEINEKSFIPEGLVYFRVLPEETIKNYIVSLLISISTTKPLKKSYDLVDTKLYEIKETFSLIKACYENFTEGIPKEKLSSKYIISFKKNGEIQDIKHALNNFLSLLHANGSNNIHNTLKCNCYACKLFCCKIVKRSDGIHDKIMRRLQTSVNKDDVSFQYSVAQKDFDLNVFSFGVKASETIGVIKSPPLLIISHKSFPYSPNQDAFKNFILTNNCLFIENSSTIYSLHSILFTTLTNFESLVYVKTPEGWKSYRNGLFFQGSITFQEICANGFTPVLTFYEKKNFLYISALLEALSSLQTFKYELDKFDKIEERWFKIFKELLNNRQKMHNPREIWEFKITYNESTYEKISEIGKKFYNIEYVIGVVLKRIHIESNCLDNSCPVCVNFLLLGKCWRSDNRESYNLYTTRLVNYLVPNMERDVFNNTLSFIYDKNIKNMVAVQYELEKLPNVLIYICVYEKIKSNSPAKILETCKNTLKDVITINCSIDNIPRTYKLNSIIFQIKNGYDEYCTAEKDNNSNLWRFYGSEMTCKEAYETIDIVYEIKKRKDFFPAQLFYSCI